MRFLIRSLIFLGFFSIAFKVYCQSSKELVFTKSQAVKEQELTPFLQIFTGSHSETISFNTLHNLYANQFSPFDLSKKDFTKPIQWLKFTINNASNEYLEYKISIIFTDKISIYTPDGNGGYKLQNTGDMVPVSKRDPEIGQMVFANLPVNPLQKNTYFIKLESQTGISQQFKKLTLESIRIYSDKRFKKLFINSRLYQSAFYGAIVVIFLYNLFIFFSLRNKFSFLYLIFIINFVVFLASNNGFFAETFLDEYPRLDLYIRFLSTPFLLFFYTLFSKSYLKLKEFAPTINQLINYWMCLLIVIILIMITGNWALGRTLVTFSGIANFIVIGLIAFYSLKKGFSPAKFFLAANILFIISGILFALQRINFVVYDPLNQYQTQISAVLQIALFSLGLAERIQLVRKELVEKTVENEKLERQKEFELKKLAEEKNQALQNVVDELDMFIYKTSHDIRGPIARVMGLSKVALMEVEDKSARNYFNLLEKESINLSDTLKRLSIVYEINHLALKKEKIYPLEIVEKVIVEIKKKYDCEKISLKVDINDKVEMISDRFIIDFIFKNLIENAVKFVSLKKESFVSVNLDTFQNNYLISVIDNGIGISPQNNKLIFDMFSRAASIHQSPGLGLYMTKLAAEKLSGNIQLVNNTNGFTHFAVNLPK